MSAEDCRHFRDAACRAQTEAEGTVILCCRVPGHIGAHHNPHVGRYWANSETLPRAEADLEALAARAPEAYVKATRDAALTAAEALEARYRAGIRAAVAALHAAHLALPDGESVPREFVDAAMLGVEAHLFAAMRGES